MVPSPGVAGAVADDRGQDAGRIVGLLAERRHVGPLEQRVKRVLHDVERVDRRDTLAARDPRQAAGVVACEMAHPVCTTAVHMRVRCQHRDPLHRSTKEFRVPMYVWHAALECTAGDQR